MHMILCYNNNNFYEYLQIPWRALCNTEDVTYMNTIFTAVRILLMIRNRQKAWNQDKQNELRTIQFSTTEI